jgi:hypothetical protein
MSGVVKTELLINGSLIRVRARVGEPNKIKAAYEITRSGFFSLKITLNQWVEACPLLQANQICPFSP